MRLFKSREEKRIERDMKVRSLMRDIERAITQQGKFADDFIANARRAKQIGDEGQYQFIRNALKRTALVKRMLQRQLLSMKNAMLIQQQAQATSQFAKSMDLMARQIGKVFGAIDLSATQRQWEKAMTQADTLSQRMDLFLESMENTAEPSAGASDPAQVSDDEIDRMISADVLAEEKAEMTKLDELDGQIARELGENRSSG